MTDPKPKEHIYPPTVNPDTRELIHLSPSSTDAFDARTAAGCPRRWYFTRVMGMKEPASAAMTAGVAFHKEWEDYLRTGRNGLGKVTRQTQHLLPAPGPDLVLEGYIETLADRAARRVVSPVQAAGVPFVGKIDLQNPRGLRLAIPHREDIPVGPDPVGTVEIGDHKTTSDPRNMKTEQQLRESTQMLAYGMKALAAFPGVQRVRLSHFYAGTRKSFGEKRSVLLNATTIQELWHSRVEPLVPEIRAVAKAERAEDVPQNRKACHAYKRDCPFIDNCFADPFERIKALGLLNRVKSQPPAPAQAAPVGENPAPGVKPTVTTPAGQTIKPAAGGVTGDTYSSQQQAVAQVDELGTPRRQLLIEDHTADTVPVLPPDAPPSDPAKAAVPIAADGQPAPAEAKPKRGRKPKEPATASTEAVPAALAVAAAPEAGQAAPVATQTPAGGLVLFVDCIPTGTYQRLEGYVADLHQAVCQAAGALDMAAVEYGKGRGLLRAAAAKAPPPSGNWVVFSSDLAAPVIEALIPLAAFVVQGVRR